MNNCAAVNMVVKTAAAKVRSEYCVDPVNVVRMAAALIAVPPPPAAVKTPTVAGLKLRFADGLQKMTLLTIYFAKGISTALSDPAELMFTPVRRASKTELFP